MATGTRRPTLTGEIFMWTKDNTDGFTQAQLDTINAARWRVINVLVDDACDDDTVFQINKSVDDAIACEWYDDVSADNLASAILSRFGWRNPC